MSKKVTKEQIQTAVRKLEEAENKRVCESCGVRFKDSPKDWHFVCFIKKIQDFDIFKIDPGISYVKQLCGKCHHQYKSDV